MFKNKYLNYLEDEKKNIPVTILRLERERLNLYNDEISYMAQEKVMENAKEEEVQKYLKVLQKRTSEVREAQELIGKDIAMLREREKNISQAIVTYTEREKII